MAASLSTTGTFSLTKVHRSHKAELPVNNAADRKRLTESGFQCRSVHSLPQGTEERILLLSCLQHSGQGSACLADKGEPRLRLKGTCKAGALSADPTAPLVCVCVCISGHEGAVAVDKLQRITLNVPFRMPTGTRLNVATESAVSTFPKRFANGLRFFAGNQNIEHLSLRSLRSLRIAISHSSPNQNSRNPIAKVSPPTSA